LLFRNPYGYLIGANGLTAVAGFIQQMLMGWLSVAWGHSWLFLIAFAVARVLPKVALTLPAGIICDRTSRTKVLLLCRALNVVASLLPLVGFFAPLPMVWLMTGIALGGAIHAFDLPAGRAVLADVTEPEDLGHVIALNNGASHIAALVGPPAAFLLGPLGLFLSAALFLGASLLTLGLRGNAAAPTALPSASRRPALRELVDYLASAPKVSLLIALGLTPGLIDRIVTLLLPSITHGQGNVSLALLAPELGALAAALALSMLSYRFGLAAILACAGAYAALLALALHFSYQAELLVLGLALAGIAKLTFNTTSHAEIQAAVPANLRGRALAL
jgi:MFS family permease